MNIVLIGYRGTGKSKVGKALSRLTGKPVVSLDEEIVNKAQMTIPQIVERHGWDWFRDLETQVTLENAKRDNFILDTGGGVILREENVAALKENGQLIWLTASVEVIAGRIGDCTNRPALVDGKTFVEEIEEVLEVRTPLYKAAADFTIISRDDRSPEQVAEKILSLINA